MTIIVIAFCIVIASALGLVGYMVHRNVEDTGERVAAANALANVHQLLSDAMMEAERAKFSEQQIAQALASEKARADALTDFISHTAKAKDANADLAPDDVDGRVLRLSQRWGSVSGAGSKVPAVAGGDVHGGTAQAKST